MTDRRPKPKAIWIGSSAGESRRATHCPSRLRSFSKKRSGKNWLGEKKNFGSCNIDLEAK
jgi:hypothetical protein